MAKFLCLSAALAVIAISSADGSTISATAGRTYHGSCGGYSKCAGHMICEDGTCKIASNQICDPKGTPCISGTVCTSGVRGRVCRKGMFVGGPCGGRRGFQCQGGLVCDGGKCLISKGSSCVGNQAACVSGTSCTRQGSDEICSAVVEAGGECGRGQFSVCAGALKCDGRVCAIPEGDNCLGNEDLCASGLACVSAGTRKVCSSSSTIGGSCRSSANCEEGLTCDSGVCKIPARSSCLGNENGCASGLSCVGTSAVKKCKELMGVGGRCGQDAFWVCAGGLLCENNVCTISEGGNCDGNESRCAEGLTCIGGGSIKKCQRSVPVGGSCGSADVCEGSLVCDSETCGIPRGGVCEISDSACVSGTTCVGSAGDTRCVQTGDIGDECGSSPLSVCSDGLTCDGNVCLIPKGEYCNGNEDMCASGLKCTGTGAGKQCQSVVSVGGSCASAGDCAAGLSCEDRQCRIPEGADCLVDGAVCVSGTSCVGTLDNKECSKPKTAGQSCGRTPSSLCADDLLCEDNECKIPEGSSCNGNESSCVSGLNCVAIGSGKLCANSFPVGSSCSTSSTCDDGLTCDGGVCKIPERRSCFGNETGCASGLACVGTPTVKKCKVLMSVGERCGQDPFWVCENGLVCVDTVCQESR